MIVLHPGKFLIGHNCVAISAGSEHVGLQTVHTRKSGECTENHLCTPFTIDSLCDDDIAAREQKPVRDRIFDAVERLVEVGVTRHLRLNDAHVTHDIVHDLCGIFAVTRHEHRYVSV